MNYLKRAWLSVTRRKGKSLLLFVIIFILSNVIAGAVSIQQATQNVEKSIKSKMGAAATVRLDYENMKESDYENIEELSKDTITKVGELSYVKYYDYVMTGYMGSESLKAYVPELLEEQGGMTSGDDMSAYYTYGLRGVQSDKIVPLEEGTITIVEGRSFAADEVANGKAVTLMSKELAELNQIKAGDTATFVNAVFDYENNEIKSKTEYPLEVVGIYQSTTSKDKKSAKSSDSANSDDWNKAYQEQMEANQIYVPNKLVEETRRENMTSYLDANSDMTETDLEESISVGEPLYLLKNPEDLEKFKQDAKALLPQHYIVFASSDDYDNIAGPVKSMSKIAGYVLIAAISASVMVITLVVLLFLRDRKHELGIYLSLGEAKAKVVMQTLIEVFIIALVAISLSVFSGNIMAKGISDTLIQNQIQQQDQMGGGITYYGLSELNSDTTLDDVVEEYEVSLTPSYVALMYGIGLGTVLVATIIPTTYVVRLNPKRIMM